MAADLQGLGVAGLSGAKPKTEFDLVFTSNLHRLQLHEQQAGVNVLLPTPTLHLSDDDEQVLTTVRHIESVAELSADQRWSTRMSQGFRDGDEDVWLNDWLCAVMDDCAAADKAVRRALIESIDDELVANIEDAINLEIGAIAERRYAEE
ncbi:MAG: hypothetical protein O9341_06500 [Paucibacter sp.]|nr:hypothetical protein [Roseateles sp.]